jgi:hypothetical protein
MIDIAPLKFELETLENELKVDPRLVKIELLRNLIALYSSNKTESAEVIPPVAAAIAAASNAAPKRRRRKKLVKRGPAKIRLIELEVLELLKGVKTAHRRDIVKHLTDKKIMGGERDPMRAFATHMTALRDVFEPDGKGNFSIIMKDKPTAVADPGVNARVARKPLPTFLEPNFGNAS